MMPTEALYKIIKEFIPDAINDFQRNYDSRLKVQKLIYLFEEIRGVNSYRHSWYLAGPYSSTLTSQVYNSLLQAEPVQRNKWDDLEFTKPIKEVNDSLHSLIREAVSIEPSLNETMLFELLASVWYIIRKYKFNTGDCQKIKEKLLLAKPHFDEIENNKIEKLISLVNTYIIKRIN